MTAALNLQSLAQLSAERILNCTAEGMVIALLAWLLLRAIGPQNSGTRFAVWFAALLGIAALPLFGNWAASGAEYGTAVRDHHAGLVGALHICCVVADGGCRIAQSGPWFLAFAAAPQELRAGRCRGPRSHPAEGLWRSSTRRGR